MKIIGVAGNGHFLATVSQVEIEKALDCYYGKLKINLNVGTEINLGAGHDFRGEIQSVCREMMDAMKQFERARATLTAFALMVSNLPPELQPESKDGDA